MGKAHCLCGQTRKVCFECDTKRDVNLKLHKIDEKSFGCLAYKAKCDHHWGGDREVEKTWVTDKEPFKARPTGQSGRRKDRRLGWRSAVGALYPYYCMHTTGPGAWHSTCYDMNVLAYTRKHQKSLCVSVLAIRYMTRITPSPHPHILRWV